MESRLREEEESAAVTPPERDPSEAPSLAMTSPPSAAAEPIKALPSVLGHDAEEGGARAFWTHSSLETEAMLAAS